MSGFGALNGIRVLDLTQMLAGPFGTMMLADHGAEVIKIEAPSEDMTRKGGPHRGDDTEMTHGAYFQSVNRNKKSVVLDLKTEEDREALLKLVETADAICENFRTGVMDRLGIGWDVLHARNPRIVYASLNGFGNAKTGEGQMVDISMVDCVMATCERVVYQHSIDGRVSGPEGNHHPFLSPFGVFRAKEGFITVGAPVDAFFRIMVTELGMPELADDPRFANHGPRGANKAELIPLLEEVTSKFTKAELQEKLGGKVPFGPVMGIDEIATDPHFAAREMLVEVEQPGSSAPLQIAGVPTKMTETPGRVVSRAPYLGEHNKDYPG